MRKGSLKKTEKIVPLSKNEYTNICLIGGTKEIREKITSLANEFKAYIVCCSSILDLDSKTLGKGVILIADPKLYRDIKKLQDALYQAEIPNPLVACSDSASLEEIVVFIRGGGMSFITTPKSSEEFLKFLEEISKYTITYYKENENIIESRKKISLLTKREKEALTLICAGHQNKVVARKMNVSPRTIEIHRSQSLHKTETYNAPAATSLLLKSQSLNRNL